MLSVQGIHQAGKITRIIDAEALSQFLTDICRQRREAIEHRPLPISFFPEVEPLLDHDGEPYRIFVHRLDATGAATTASNRYT